MYYNEYSVLPVLILTVLEPDGLSVAKGKLRTLKTILGVSVQTRKPHHNPINTANNYNYEGISKATC